MTASGLSSHLAAVPADIADALAKEYGELESRFARGDWDPAGLKAGRFAEIVLRYLDEKQSDSHTPIGQQINRSNITNRVKNDVSLPDGLRFLVRRCTDLLMDVRNKRDVAHPGVTVDVKEMDAKLVMRLAAWSLSEIIREESDLDPSEIQAVIDRLSATQFPLVEEIGGELVVVAKSLTSREQALVVLYHEFPDSLPLDELQRAVKYRRAGRFRKMMEEAADKGITHINGDDVYLTRSKGVPWVEKNIEMRVEV